MRFVGKSDHDGILLSMCLQQGVLVKFLPGETVKSFILRILSLRKEEMEREIQTLILNNGCVDDPDTWKLVTGDTLVLSGAMPGLVGAMLRSNSPIKVLRESLSGSETRRDSSIPEDMVRLKLFNSVLTGHKDDLLKNGFYVEESES